MLPATTPTTDVSDAHPELQVCETQLRQFGGEPVFGGRIRTLKCLGDTALVAQLLATPGNGDVLVIDGEGSLSRSLLGDRNAALAVDHGWSGLVINGAVRDADGLRTLPLGVKALGSTPRRGGKTGLGAIDVPVRFGSAEFLPGGFLWSDADGIVVAPPGWDSDSLTPVEQATGYPRFTP
jgi:regulator of ribonuclease activity A